MIVCGVLHEKWCLESLQGATYATAALMLKTFVLLPKLVPAYNTQRAKQSWAPEPM